MLSINVDVVFVILVGFVMTVIKPDDIKLLRSAARFDESWFSRYQSFGSCLLLFACFHFEVSLKWSQTEANSSLIRVGNTNYTFATI